MLDIPFSELKKTNKNSPKLKLKIATILFLILLSRSSPEPINTSSDVAVAVYVRPHIRTMGKTVIRVVPVVGVALAATMWDAQTHFE